MGLNGKSKDGKDDIEDETALLSSPGQPFKTDYLIQSTRSPLNVDELLETLKVGPFHYIFLLACGVCHSLYTMTYVTMGFILITACDLNIQPTSKGLLTLCYMFGVGFSSPIFGKLSDIYGRWKIMTLSVSIQLSSTIIAAFSYNYTMLLVMYFMIGIALGGSFTISPSYTIEFFPRSYRGFATGSRIAICIISNVYVCLMALVILPQEFNIYIGTFHFSSWRIYLLVCIVPHTIAYIALFFMPESLRFVLVQGRLGNIMRTLDRMKQINLCCKMCDNSSQQEIRSILLSNLDEFENKDKKQQNSVNTDQFNVKLYNRPYITRCLIMGLAWIGVGFGMEGFNIWLPTIVNFYDSGKQCRYHSYHNSSWSLMHTLPPSNVSYCTNSKVITPVISTILYGSIIAVPLALFLLFIVNHIGRKWSYFLLIFINGICMLLILLLDNKLATSIIAIIFGAFSNNIWIPLATWSAELFPTTIRSTAIGILHVLVAFIPGIGMLIVGFLFAYSCTLTLVLFISVTLLAGLIPLCVPDTTNLDIK